MSKYNKKITMRRITKTKKPSLRQMERMTKNLHTKYGGTATAQAFSRALRSGKTETQFWISVEGVGHRHAKTWEDLQGAYRSLIRRNK